MRQSVTTWVMFAGSGLLLNLVLPRFINLSQLTINCLYVVCHLLTRKLIYRTCKDSLRFKDTDVAIVTGASAGIGASCAQQVQQRGANVVLAARSVDECETVIQSNAGGTDSKTVAYALHLDLGSFKSIKAFCAEFRQRHTHLNYLVCNAGYKGGFRQTAEGFEYTFGVNHMGHALLVHELWDLLVKSGTKENPSRVVIVASDLHRLTDKLRLQDVKGKVKDFSSWSAYNQSKLCNILFARKLADLAKGTNVRVSAVHPGTPVRSKLMRNDPFMGNSMVKPVIYFAQSIFCRSEWQGAQNLLHNMLSPDVRNGDYVENCAIVDASSVALDSKAADELWAFTCKELKLSPNWPTTS